MCLLRLSIRVAFSLNKKGSTTLRLGYRGDFVQINPYIPRSKTIIVYHSHGSLRVEVENPFLSLTLFGIQYQARPHFLIFQLLDGFANFGSEV
jgi:hypothetical protein|mmetsp:Transcript_9431/g.20986  ORF Transcript_9431/g.20986 Transcript_9431/m.20986 type:complete len:93 (+) Transcript_9431:888-1166(+)